MLKISYQKSINPRQNANNYPLIFPEPREEDDRMGAAAANQTVGVGREPRALRLGLRLQEKFGNLTPNSTASQDLTPNSTPLQKLTP
jgi:hypothetical protein